MIVRLEISQPDDASATYLQLNQCQVQCEWTMKEVRIPTLLRSIRFDTLEDVIRQAKKATFAHLKAKRHRRMPCQIDWRIVHEGRTFPCPACHQPLYQKAKLGRFGNSLDLTEWGCPQCKHAVTRHTDGFLLSMSSQSQIVTYPSPPIPNL